MPSHYEAWRYEDMAREDLAHLVEACEGLIGRELEEDEADRLLVAATAIAWNYRCLQEALAGKSVFLGLLMGAPWFDWSEDSSAEELGLMFDMVQEVARLQERKEVLENRIWRKASA
jgi:hypothetical protein